MQEKVKSNKAMRKELWIIEDSRGIKMKLNVSRETFRNLVCLNITIPSIVLNKK